MAGDHKYLQNITTDQILMDKNDDYLLILLTSWTLNWDVQHQESKEK